MAVSRSLQLLVRYVGGAARAGLLFVAVATAAAETPTDTVATGAIRDLHYGDVLFHFYQGDHLGALVRLQAAREFGRLEHHTDEARLLEGGLYLSLGQHEEAGRLFAAVLDSAASPQVRDRAWLYLAKVWYQRDYLDRAAQALSSIGDALPAALEPERRLLESTVQISLGQYDAAIRALEGWQGPPGWTAYARFNLGVALVRAGRLDEASTQLDAVGAIAAGDEELAALRDKANLALGFAWLNAGRADDARAVLDRVRLSGPLSSKALLGAGWADSELERYQRALVPWLALRDRSLLDAAVQESYLAVPYAYAQLSADAQAAEHYSLAIAAYAEEASRIDQSIERIRRPDWIETVLDHDRDSRVGWYWQLLELPDAPETRYLHHLFATHRFQEGLKNYRDLELMNRNIASWSQSVDAFEDMIAAREQAAAEREVLYERTIASVDIDGLQSRAAGLAARIERAEREQDVVALATASEQARWQQVEAMAARLEALDGRDARIAPMQQKLALVRGVLYWEMNSAFKARLWRERKSLRELDVALSDAQRRQMLVERARRDTPAATGDFAARVATIEPRIVALSSRLEAARVRQSRYLAAVAIEELEAQKQRLAAYSRQAQFALATIYDRAATASTLGSEP
jgi:hypothetical protein